MAAEWTDLAKEVLKYSTRPRYAFAICATCFIVIMTLLHDSLKLDRLREDYGQYLGFAFLTSAVLWFVEVVLFFAPTYLEQRKKLKNLDSLTWYEAELLIRAVDNKSQTFSCGINLDQPYSLLQKGLLERVSEEGKSRSDRYNATFTIPRFIWVKINRDHVLSALRSIERHG
jgi:hypothetical protein